jgi:hypothetical protein
MKKHFLIASIILFLATAGSIPVLFFSSCKCLSCSKEDEAVIPVDVLAKADSFIISSTGKEFFSKYITADFYLSKHTPPYYEMAYRLYMPEKPYVNSVIKFTVDSVGNVIKNRDIVGIPACRFFPEECNFNIDEQTARIIANEMGLKDGIKEWQAGFLWDFERKRYVWKILSTLDEIGSDENYKATGQEIVIDPADGEVLALNDWRIN